MVAGEIISKCYGSGFVAIIVYITCQNYQYYLSNFLEI